MESSKVLDFEKLNNLIDDQFKIQVFIPSINTKINIQELSAKDQKILLGSAINANSIYSKDFIVNLCDIIKKLVGDDLLYKNLTIIDKISICLNLRKQITDKVKVSYEKNEKTIEVEISNILEKLEKYKHPTPENFSINNIKGIVEMPTILLEKKYEEEVHKKNIDQKSLESMEVVSNIVQEEFIGEISKYLSYVEIGEYKIDMNSISFQERMKIVSILPSSCIKEITNIVKIWKDSIDEILLVDTDKKGNKAILKIDPLLFFN